MKNNKFNELIQKAVLDGNIEVLQDCIRHGVDVEQRYSNGSTLLLTSIEHRKNNVLEVLIANGANPNSVNTEGETPLHSSLYIAFDSAIQIGQRLRLDEVLQLLRAGADLKSLDHQGKTPLDLAKSYGDTVKSMF